MPNTTGARREAGSSEQLRKRLRELRDTIAAADDRRRQLRAAQLEHAGNAIANNATVTDVATATGLSRAYLHRAGVQLHRGTQRPGRDTDPAAHAARDKALSEASRIRDELKELDTAARGAVDTSKPEKEERQAIIRTLLAEQPQIPPKELAADGGVSSEWIRRLSKKR